MAAYRSEGRSNAARLLAGDPLRRFRAKRGQTPSFLVTAQRGGGVGAGGSPAGQPASQTRKTEKQRRRNRVQQGVDRFHLKQLAGE